MTVWQYDINNGYLASPSQEDYDWILQNSQLPISLTVRFKSAWGGRGRPGGGRWLTVAVLNWVLPQTFLLSWSSDGAGDRPGPPRILAGKAGYLLENIAENKTFFSSQMVFIQFWHPVKLHSNDMENYVRLSQLNLYYLYSGYGMEYPRYLLIMLICNLIWVTE